MFTRNPAPPLSQCPVATYVDSEGRRYSSADDLEPENTHAAQIVSGKGNQSFVNNEFTDSIRSTWRLLPTDRIMYVRPSMPTVGTLLKLRDCKRKSSKKKKKMAKAKKKKEKGEDEEEKKKKRRKRS